MLSGERTKKRHQIDGVYQSETKYVRRTFWSQLPSIAMLILSATVTINLAVARTNEPDPPDEPEPCYDDCGNEIPCPPPDEGDVPTGVSSNPVHYNSGSVYEKATDLSVPGLTNSWSHTRSYNSGLASSQANTPAYTTNGDNWMASGVEYELQEQVSGDIHLVFSAQSKRIFTESSGSYTAPSDYSATLTKDTFTDSDDIDDDSNTTEVMDRFTLEETSSGLVLVFTGFDTDIPETLRGKLLERTDRAFQEQSQPGVQYSYAKQVDNTYLLGQATTTQGLNIVYTWNTSDQISKVEVKTSGGTVLQKAEYTYYEDVTANTALGGVNDLVQVKVSKLASDATNWIVRYTQYRYYLDGGTDAGEANQLKMVLEPDAIERITSAGDTAVDTPDEILAKADSYAVNSGNTIAEYASRSFTYYTEDLPTGSAVTTPWSGGDQNLQTKYGGSNFDESGYVKTETINASSTGGCCGGGSAGGITRTYFYLDLNRDGNGDPLSTDANEITRITIEDTEDASGGEAYRKVFGLNQYSRLLREAQIEDPTVTTQTIWCKSTKLDANDRISEERMPSAHACDSDADLTKFLDPYDASGPSWSNDADAGVLRSGDGVIYVHEYDTNGYRIGKKVKKGNSGTAYYVYGADYGGTGVADHIISKVYDYPDAQTSRTGGTENTTTYTYTFWDTNNSVIKKKVTTFEAVDTTHNGSGVAITNEEYYDKLGRLRWTKNGEGYINYYSYHPKTGARAYVAIDVEPTGLPNDADGNTSKWVDSQNAGADLNKPSRSVTTQELELVTTREFDDQGRETKMTESGGGVHYTIYEANRTLQFPYFIVASGEPQLPIQVSAFNDGGQTTESYTIKPSKTALNGSGLPSGLLGTTTQADYLSWTRYDYDDLTGQPSIVDNYHAIPSSGNGTPSTNFNRAVTQYDDLGRRQYMIQVVTGDGSTGVEQVTKFSYDVRDRVTTMERGVSLSGSGTNDMGSTYSTNYPTLAKIIETEYDSGGVGNGHATKIKHYHGTGANNWTGANKYYTYRGHLRGIEPIYYSSGEATTGPYTVMDTDWMGRTVAKAKFSSTSNFGTGWSTVVGDDDYAENATDGNRLSLDATRYDELGRVYASQMYAVNSSGVTGDKLVSNHYYDRNSKLIAEAVAGTGATEYAYDGAGRRYQTRKVVDLEGTEVSTPYYNATSGAFSYRDPQPKPGITGSSGNNKTNMTGGNDKVLSLDHVVIDDDGKVIRAIHWAAYHTDTDGLDAEATTKDYIQSSVYAWYDVTGRLVAQANYGTNDAGFTSAGLPDRPTTQPSPSTDAVPVLYYTYDDSTHTKTATDAMGYVTKAITDALDRTYRVEEADGETEERWTWTQYDGLSNTVKLVADIDKDDSISGGVVTTDADSQVTMYTFGDAYNASLLTEIAYPDKQDSSDVVAVTYNLDGTMATRTDQRGTVITYDYDNNRRLSKQRVTTLSTADGSIKSIKYTYDSLGRRQQITSYATNDATGTPANDLYYAYGDFRKLIREYQEHNGGITLSTAPRVDYSYSTTSSGGEYTTGLRPQYIVYPASTSASLGDFNYRRNIKFNYGTGINQSISRLYQIQDHDSSSIATYSYLGDDRIVMVDYDEPSLTLDYYGGTSGTYTGFDRFGRVVDHRWIDNGGTPTDIDRINYGYDRNSNRLWRESNLSTTNDDNEDELYTYDTLNRLTNVKRGDLNGTQEGITGSTEQFAQDWGLDAVGNWDTFKQDDDGNGGTGNWELEQTRTHNDVNEIDNDNDDGNTKGNSITANAGQTDWFDPVYDAAGNLTEFAKPGDLTGGYTAVFDAWNRLVEIKDGSYTVAKYEYDGIGRRILKDVYVSGSHDHYRHYYYAVGWQIVEERVNSATLADRQFVWGQLYIDDLILRDRQTDDNISTGNLGITGSGMDERLYALQDSYFNVTTITDADGDAIERYHYTPYGDRTILDTDYTNDADGKSDYAWTNGHQGLAYDDESSLINNRNRVLHSQLGRFIQRDPLGYVDGASLYTYYAILRGGVDPYGLIDESELENMPDYDYDGKPNIPAGWSTVSDRTIDTGYELVDGVAHASPFISMTLRSSSQDTQSVSKGVRFSIGYSGDVSGTVWFTAEDSYTVTVNVSLSKPLDIMTDKYDVRPWEGHELIIEKKEDQNGSLPSCPGRFKFHKVRKVATSPWGTECTEYMQCIATYGKYNETQRLTITGMSQFWLKDNPERKVNDAATLIREAKDDLKTATEAAIRAQVEKGL